MTRPSPRTLLIAIAGVVVVAGVIVAGWLWVSAQNQRSMAAYADVLLRAQAAEGPGVSVDVKNPVIRDLELVLQEHPTAADAPRAAYQLGNLKYSLQQYPAARAAYELALAKGAAESVKLLSQAGVGYTLEAEKNYAKAAESYAATVATLKPGQFLYEELLIDLGRAQELAGRRDDAIRTYRRVLEDPRAVRVDEVKSKLARMGVAP